MFGDLISLRIQKHKLIKHKVRFSQYFLFLWVKLCSNQILCMKSRKHHSGHRSINRSVHKTSENSSAQFHRAACDVSKSPNHENTSLHVSMFKKFSIQTLKQSFSFDQLITLRPDTCGSSLGSGSLLENVALKENPFFNILSAEANLRLFHCCCFCCWCLFKINANKELQVTKLRRTENHANSSYSSHYSAAHPQKSSQFTLYFNF